jgi:hypothetical protein
LATIWRWSTEAEVADLRALCRAFVGACGGLFDKSVVANPGFALSGKLGGADGDLIVDGCLVDFKTTTDQSMPRQAGYQLLGYLLADTDDAHGIDQVGFYLARVPALISWPAAALVAEVSEGRAAVEELRVDFAAVVAAVRAQRRKPAL